MKLMSFLILIAFLSSVNTYASESLREMALDTKVYECHINLKEPAVGFVSENSNNLEAEKIENYIRKSVLAISRMHARERVVETEIRAFLDGRILVDTGLYVEGAATAEKNKRASTGAVDRKKLYKEFKDVSCN